ncbi:MAG TPA: hypothetical protein VI874_03500, partial [Candidatus Norongarragalinales archaeon]|nr:hypothetical protein [Candidatus Norongarragalinales archaeon]
ELEKRSRFNHYYESERPTQWWTRAAAQFRIGERVSQEIRQGHENADWIKERVEHWVDVALDYYEKNHAEKVHARTG